jgi:hypothetical protein
MENEKVKNVCLDDKKEKDDMTKSAVNVPLTLYTLFVHNILPPPFLQ